jgi:alpha-beta hydrolase superfamily lysophospholipase
LLIRGLVDAGYGVIALDAPAHGRSPGREANVVLFARALLEAASELPPLLAVIGHSMGGASALLATQMGLRCETLVTVAAAELHPRIVARFRSIHGAAGRGTSAFRSRR